MNELSDFAASDNAALKDIIEDRIRKEGPISFRDFMELALYHPVQGYYFAGDPSRDYQSSPEVHPVFGAAIGRLLAELWRLLDRPARFDVLESGAGRGRLAADVLRWLRAHDQDAWEATAYVLQDISYARDPSERLERAGVPLQRVRARTDLPAEGEVEGVVLSNELLDAFPVCRVRVRDGVLREVRVGMEAGRLVDVEAEAPPEVECYFEALGLVPGEGADAEVNLQAPEWIERAGSALRRGYVLTLDYGYPARELYAPWRRQGTLLTFYRHTSQDDPFVRIGRQDITASVDFTSIVRAGEKAGLRPLALTTQAELLAALGAGAALAQRPLPGQMEEFYALRRAVIELTDQAGLGRAKALLQGKGTPDSLPLGFEGKGDVRV